MRAGALESCLAQVEAAMASSSTEPPVDSEAIALSADKRAVFASVKVCLIDVCLPSQSFKVIGHLHAYWQAEHFTKAELDTGKNEIVPFAKDDLWDNSLACSVIKSAALHNPQR